MPDIKTTFVASEDLEIHPSLSIGTISECVENVAVTGELIDYCFFVANGRRILLGHYDFPAITSFTEISGAGINAIFVTQGNRKKHITTWENLRAHLKDGWIIGTVRYPGVKIWFASTGKNSRRDADKILVARG